MGTGQIPRGLLPQSLQNIETTFVKDNKVLFQLYKEYLGNY